MPVDAVFPSLLVPQEPTTFRVRRRGARQAHAVFGSSRRKISNVDIAVPPFSKVGKSSNRSSNVLDRPSVIAPLNDNFVADLCSLKIDAPQ